MADQPQIKPEEKGFRVKSTPAFKLKDREKRRFVFINLKQQFGFVPEVIIVEKVMGSNNGLVVRAILTEAEIKSEDARIKFHEESIRQDAKHAKEQLEIDKQKINGDTKSSTPETTTA